MVSFETIGIVIGAIVGLFTIIYPIVKAFQKHSSGIDINKKGIDDNASGVDENKKEIKTVKEDLEKKIIDVENNLDDKIEKMAATFQSDIKELNQNILRWMERDANSHQGIKDELSKTQIAIGEIKGFLFHKRKKEEPSDES